MDNVRRENDWYSGYSRSRWSAYNDRGQAWYNRTYRKYVAPRSERLSSFLNEHIESIPDSSLYIFPEVPTISKYTPPDVSNLNRMSLSRVRASARNYFRPRPNYSALSYDRELPGDPIDDSDFPDVLSAVEATEAQDAADFPDVLGSVEELERNYRNAGLEIQDYLRTLSNDELMQFQSSFSPVEQSVVQDALTYEFDAFGNPTGGTVVTHDSGPINVDPDNSSLVHLGKRVSKRNFEPYSSPWKPAIDFFARPLLDDRPVQRRRHVFDDVDVSLRPKHVDVVDLFPSTAVDEELFKPAMDFVPASVRADADIEEIFDGVDMNPNPNSLSSIIDNSINNQDMSSDYQRGYYSGRNKYRRLNRYEYNNLRRLRNVGPDSKYGYARILRGTDENIARFGASYADATAEQRALRQQTGFTGRGMYSFTDAARGALVGGLRGAVRGGVNAFLGRGDYTATNALITGDGMSTQNFDAVYASGPGGELQVSKTEYLRDMVATGANGGFESFFIPINPGLSTSFPWLSQMANNFNVHEPVQCIFQYRSTTSDIGNSTSGIVGTIIMAHISDPLDPAYKSKAEMLDSNNGVTVKLTEHANCGVECDPSKITGRVKKYVRHSPVVAGAQSDYDLGYIQIVLNNVPAANLNLSLGELYVTYTWRFSEPKLNTNSISSYRSDLFCTGSVSPFWGTLGSNAYMGTSVSNIYSGLQNNLGCSLIIGTPLQGVGIQFGSLVGTFKISIVCSTLANTVFTVNPTFLYPTFVGNCNVINDILAGTSNPVPRIVCGISTGAGPNSFIYTEFHVYSNPSSLNNNTVFCAMNSQTYTDKCQTQITIEAYNSQGCETTGTGPVLIRNGVVVSTYPV